jgi:hypothetical protein
MKATQLNKIYFTKNMFISKKKKKKLVNYLIFSIKKIKYLI